MARDYTQEEIDTSVGKIVRTSIQHPYGALGNRGTNVSFSEIQDAAAGVFIAKANAPYYVVSLANNIAQETATTLQNTLTDLDDTVRSISRLVHPVDSTTDLANANSALKALSSATQSRSTSLESIEGVPAYQRFDASTKRFIDQYGGNISSGGSVVQTPQEARDRIATLITNTEQSYDSILSQVNILSGAIEDFDSLNLPATVASYIIGNSQDVIEQRLNELDALSEEQRLAVLRDVVLDLLSSRSAVRGFGSLDATFLFLYFAGSGGPYADETHPATSAVVASDTYAPWAILDDTGLDFVVDGVTPISVNAPESYVATLEAFIGGPYEIISVPNPPAQPTINNRMLINVIQPDLGTEVETEVNFPDGSLAAWNVVDLINTELGVSSPAEAYVWLPNQFVFDEPVSLNATFPFAGEFTKINGDWDDTQVFQVQVGDQFLVDDSSDPNNNGVWEVNDVSNLPATFTAIKVDPAVNISSDTFTINMTKGATAPALTFKASEAVNSIQGQWAIELPSDRNDEVIVQTLLTFGWIQDVRNSSQPTTAADVAQFINAQPAIANFEEELRMVAGIEWGAIHFSGVGRTDPSDANSAVLYKLQAEGIDVTAGVSATFSGFTDLTDINVGDAINITDTLNNQITNWGIITAVGVSSVTATMNEATVAESGISVELGDDWRGMALPQYLRVQSTSQGANNGEYEVVSIGGIEGDGPPFHLGVGRPFTVPYSPGFIPATIEDAQYGNYKVTFQSVSTLLDTKMEVLDTSTAGPTFFNSLPVSDVGETSFFTIPSKPLKVEIDDTVDFKDDNSQAVTFTRTISGTENAFNGAPNLLEFTEPVSTTLQSYSWAQNSPAPSARVRKLRKDNYDQYKVQLDEWLLLPLSDPTKYFRDLRRLINPLIANQNPTVADVAAASGQVQDLAAHITALQGILASYTAPLVEAVDRIIDTYREQGADRAVDVLISAQFSTFFTLPQSGTSYNADLRDAMRQVNINDLPVSKLERNPGGMLIDSYEEPDFEYDLTDTEDVVEPLPPGEVYDLGDSAF